MEENIITIKNKSMYDIRVVIGTDGDLSFEQDKADGAVHDISFDATAAKELIQTVHFYQKERVRAIEAERERLITEQKERAELQRLLEKYPLTPTT